MARPDTIAIVGTGLIGGSLGLAVKRHKLAEKVIGISRTKESLAAAKRLGAIDEGSRDIGAVAEADLVILCLPVGEIIRQAGLLTRTAGKDSVICDVGSTKERISAVFARLTPRFVGCHPMAGSEKRGMVNASRSLFDGSLCILTPEKNTDRDALSAAGRFWSRICAGVCVMKPAEHDRIMSLVSHLPHAAAFALVNSVPAGMLVFSAGGFRDTTRLAGSNEKLWADIFLTNRRNVVSALEVYEKKIRLLKASIRDGNGKALRTFLQAAKNKRLKLA